MTTIILVLEIAVLIVGAVLLVVGSFTYLNVKSFSKQAEEDTIIELTPTSDNLPVPEVDMSQVPVKFYATCVCTKSNKARIYRSFITEDFIAGDPSAEELRNLRDKILEDNPEYNDCVILFFGKLRG